MSALTRIDAVVDALVELCRTATGLQVVDGPFVGELDDNVLILGVPDGSTPGYTTTPTRQQGMGRAHLREAWEVRCLLSLSGGDDVHALRAQAAAHIGALDDALRDVSAASLAWDRAGVAGSNMSWVPVQGPTGAVMAVLFSFEGESLL